MTQYFIPDPCPFCSGTKAELSEDRGEYFILCIECGSRGPASDIVAVAQRCWNRRIPPEDTPQTAVNQEPTP